MKENTETNILFIISNARSGSTMLRQLLNTHSNIGFPEREFGEFNEVLANFDSYNDLSSPTNFRNFYEDAQGITTLNLKKTTDTKQGVYTMDEHLWFKGSKSYRLDDLYKYLLEFFVQKSQPSKLNIFWVGDKSPQHSRNITSLIKYFPNARYIFLTRNPIDISLSQDRFSFRHFNEKYGYEEVTQSWKDLHLKNNYILKARISKNIKRLITTRNTLKKSGVNYTEVSYESLLDNLNLVLKNIASFLAIPNNFEIEKFQIRKSSSGQTEGVAKVLTSNKLKYLITLNPKMISYVNKEFEDGINKALDIDNTLSYQYKISNPKLFLYKIQYFFNIAISFSKNLGLKKALSLIMNKFYFKNYKKM
ncbi:sulfotransferase [Ichthyenterobacterium sp. W332]|uniref:Sulfotransferase n=1 Tax=Microcosmobacter mediterraneus TaxID=3075607 RepID=A0ABU2YMJ5_9FLAO|nr:sulfotransferase [Ichthyenterobacterium sp. W332]MDT0559387.1 sulfotransferase [Ichthyenterobacterium sp. W332]